MVKFCRSIIANGVGTGRYIIDRFSFIDRLDIGLRVTEPFKRGPLLREMCRSERHPGQTGR